MMFMNPMRIRFNFLLMMVLLVMSASMTGCDKEKAQLATFPHAPHHENEVSCDSCHELTDEGVTYPQFMACTMCHEPDDEAIFGDCNSCHEQAGGVELTDESIVSHKELFAEYLPEGWNDVYYNHAEHLEGDPAECLACHSQVTKTHFSTVENLPSMETSMAYHQEQGISNDCNVCHLELNEFTKPASHDRFWNEKHGRMMQFQDDDSCLMCHQENSDNSCFTCHQTEEPRNHTNLWRRKTHGIQAAFDRGSCITCHRNDECETCHRATASPIPPTEYHNPDAPCAACHAPQGGGRRPGEFIKLMPHRMMMGTSGEKCMECHLF